MRNVRVPQPKRRLLILAMLALGGLVPMAAPASAAQGSAAVGDIHDAGQWDLIFEKGNRRCRLLLRPDVHAGGYAVGMPAVCHHAFPALAGVTNWTSGAGEHVVLRSEAGTAVMAFGPDGTAALSGLINGADTYTLTPVDLALQDTVRAAPVAAAPPPVAAAETPATGVVVERGAGKAKGAAARQAPAAPQLPPVTPAQVAGNYAVLRKDKDTGCMVTLEPGGTRARLAPACRDQGIVIFDPTGWKLEKGELVLMAKRGHSTALTRRDDKTWANAPERGAALTLKRL